MSLTGVFILLLTLDMQSTAVISTYTTDYHIDLV